MKNNISIAIMTLIVATLTLVSCATKKSIEGNQVTTAVKKTSSNSAETAKMDFLRKVYDNEVYTTCLTSKINFTLNTGSKEISVAGSLKMKRDDVIRIQLTPFGLMEVGRIEFTKDYVLIMDRINKRYVKEDYTQVDFLQRNGLDFYALQALFWNQLYVPGEMKITESALKKFTVGTANNFASTPITLVRDNMSYQFTAENSTGHITNTKVTYNSKANGKTEMDCTYGSFKSILDKQFPTDVTLKMNSDAVKQGRTVTVNLQLEGLDTQTNWETRTEVSSKYRKVTVQEVLQQLTKLK